MVGLLLDFLLNKWVASFFSRDPCDYLQAGRNEGHYGGLSNKTMATTAKEVDFANL